MDLQAVSFFQLVTYKGFQNKEEVFSLTGKSAGCPAFLLQGRGGKPTL